MFMTSETKRGSKSTERAGDEASAKSLARDRYSSTNRRKEQFLPSPLSRRSAAPRLLCGRCAEGSRSADSLPSQTACLSLFPNCRYLCIAVLPPLDLLRPVRTPRRFLLLAALLVVASLGVAGCAGENLLSQIVNFWSLSCCGSVLVILDIIALVELAGSPRSTGNKLAWAAVVVLFPYLGCFLYYVFGR